MELIELSWSERFKERLTGLSDQTKTRYGQLVDKFTRVIGDKPKYDLDDVLKFLSFLETEEEASSTYMRWCFSVLKTFYEVFSWPWPSRREERRLRPKLSAPNRPYLKIQEQQKLLEVGPRFPDMVHAMIRISCIKPTRRGEFRKLNREDYRRPYLTIEILKQRKPVKKTITLDPLTCDLLDRYLASRRDRNPALFVSNRGKRMSEGELSRIAKKVFKAAGVDKKGMGWHGGRRGSTTVLHKAGMSVKELQEYGAWATPSMVMEYIMLEPGEADAKARAVHPLIKFKKKKG